ncbi:polar amino acid transport system permease protein [Kibdelosporangium banguiense]|uniref:Polar amino acid transport system permease protein n=1 Tax=Kibdelosporangium banguiense TaxID=1365924 RepID=A0ABS4TR88_9PSEU|nr:amino acid ABC transporter permease [Kibdelosporangium banguiense]MBP2326920.1 polar amino acid transport system permease protein [Kibdelosporangium banguiense]
MTTSVDHDVSPDSSRRPPTEMVQLKHPGRVIGAVFALLLAFLLFRSFLTNENYEWEVVGEYLFNEQIMLGLGRTLILTAVAMTVGILFGIVLATCRLSENKVISLAAGAYLWFFRGTPLLIQLVFWYNLSALYPHLGISLPFGGPELWGGETNKILDLWFVALLGLSLNESAYMAEIVRGGLLAVPRQQTEAAKALGMSSWLTFRRIVLPQALRVIVPPTGNQVIGMLKHSSLVSVIALPELLYSAQLIYSQSFQTIPLLIVVALWYLLCTTVLSMIQSRIERYYGRGSHPTTPTKKSLRQRLRTRNEEVAK